MLNECSICNAPVELQNVSEYSESYGLMKALRLCYDCAFWTQTMLADLSGRNWFIANGNHYVIGPEDAKGFRGFAGAKVEVHFNDGRVVTTTNLWDQGDVSLFFRPVMQDTATIIWK